MSKCRFRAMLFVAMGCLGMAGGSASGAAYNFATFTETGSSRPFTFINNDGGNDAVIGTTQPGISGLASVDVTFNFTAGTGLPTADHDATLILFTGGGPSADAPASLLSNGLVDQPIAGITLLRLTDAATGKNLLTMNFQGDIVGRDGNPSALLSGVEGSPAPVGGFGAEVVSFTSDFLTFAGGNSFGLSLAAITPELSVGPGGYLNSFTADMTGQFSGDTIAVPEPASPGALGFTMIALVRRRRP